MTTFTTIDSPVGPLLLAADDNGIRAIEFQPSRHAVKRETDWAVTRIDGDLLTVRRGAITVAVNYGGSPVPASAWSGRCPMCAS